MKSVNLLEIKPDEHIKILGADDLMLDKLASLVYPSDEDAEKRRYASGVLLSPLCEPDNIAYRRDIARDFLASGNLLNELDCIARGSEELRKSWQEERLRHHAATHSLNGGENGEQPDNHAPSDPVGAKLENLKINLSYFLKLYSRFKELIDLLAASTLYAEGMLHVFCP